MFPIARNIQSHTLSKVVEPPATLSRKKQDNQPESGDCVSPDESFLAPLPLHSVDEDTTSIYGNAIARCCHRLYVESKVTGLARMKELRGEADGAPLGPCPMNMICNSSSTRRHALFEHFG
jgi:hypothetical protein